MTCGLQISTRAASLTAPAPDYQEPAAASNVATFCGNLAQFLHLPVHFVICDACQFLFSILQNLFCTKIFGCHTHFANTMQNKLKDLILVVKDNFYPTSFQEI